MTDTWPTLAEVAAHAPIAELTAIARDLLVLVRLRLDEGVPTPATIVADLECVRDETRFPDDVSFVASALLAEIHHWN